MFKPEQTGLALILLFICSSAYAEVEVTEYEIEIAIFEDSTNAYLNSEFWPDTTETPADYSVNGNDTANEERSPVDNQDKNAITIIKKRLLGEYVKKLKNSNQYNLLAHKAWRQPGLGSDSAITVAINSEQPDLIANNSESVTEEPEISIISGTIKVVVERYLHVYTDLTYNRSGTLLAPVVSIDQQAKELTRFHIKAHRKMRSKEPHYIDHPLIGILIMAMPVEKHDAAGKHNQSSSGRPGITALLSTPE